MKASHVATCIGCTCNDLRACITDAGPCSWLRIDRKMRVGVCSGCQAMVARWDEGQRTQSPPKPFDPVRLQHAKAAAIRVVADYGEERGEALKKILAGDIPGDHVALRAVLMGMELQQNLAGQLNGAPPGLEVIIEGATFEFIDNELVLLRKSFEERAAICNGKVNWARARGDRIALRQQRQLARVWQWAATQLDCLSLPF